MKFPVSAITVAATGLALMVAVIQLTRWQSPSSPPPAAGRGRTLLPVVKQTAWGETHASIELHPPPRDGELDTAWLSRAVAELPTGIVENGGVLVSALHNRSGQRSINRVVGTSPPMKSC